MDDKKSGYTDEQITNLAYFAAQKLIDKQEALRNSDFGCPTATGCSAGKKHFDEHHLKFDSDIYNSKLFMKEQNKINKLSADKYHVAATMFQSTAQDVHVTLVKLIDLIKIVEENKKEAKIDLEKKTKTIWTTLRWAAGIFIATVTAIFITNK